jgi:hypothetical protein
MLAEREAMATSKFRNALWEAIALSVRTGVGDGELVGIIVGAVSPPDRVFPASMMTVRSAATAIKAMGSHSGSDFLAPGVAGDGVGVQAFGRLDPTGP